MELAERLRRILDLALEALERSQRAGITDLPAALAVEGRLVEQQLDRVADFGILDSVAVLDDCQDDPLAFVAGITGKFGRSMLLSEVEPDILARFRARTLPRRAGLGL